MHRVIRTCRNVRTPHTVIFLLIFFGFVIITILILRPTWADRTSPARMAVDPPRVSVNEGVFTLTIMAESDVAVNTFSGELHFDPAIVAVDTINFRSSIASLWVNEPTYDNVNGLIYFIGGTTQVGGFIGSGTLFTVTFKTLTSGVTTIGFTEATFLQHDGYGTPVDLEASGDTVVTISPSMFIENIPASPPNFGGSGDIVRQPLVSTEFDLNGDGVASFSDVGVFIEFMNTGNLIADFDGDSEVTKRDLELLLLRI